MKICQYMHCNNPVTSKHKKAKYCSPRCKQLESSRLYRFRRNQEGKLTKAEIQQKAAMNFVKEHLNIENGVFSQKIEREKPKC